MSLAGFYSSCAIPKSLGRSLLERAKKGVTARLRSRKKRADEQYAAKIREQVSARDGFCRYGMDRHPGRRLSRCEGVSEWAHAPWHGRWSTRGLPPEKRHTTADSLMACSRHHAMLHNRQLRVIALTPRRCDGPLYYEEGMA